MGFILIVDDQEDNRYTLSHRLKKKGYDTLEAESGYEALECLQRKSGEIAG